MGSQRQFTAIYGLKIISHIKTSNIKFGVPQGNLLGPLLFILMILLMYVTFLILTYLLMMGHFYLKISAGKLT